jgi:putative type IV pilus protein pilM
MYPIAIVALFLGLFATLSSLLPRVSVEDYSRQALATNFCIYRTAVANYVQSESDIEGISDNNLNLPYGYISIRPWQTRIANGYCYIFGEATPDEIVLIREKMGNSILIGRNENNRLSPSGVPVAINLPAGNVVSIVSLP